MVNICEVRNIRQSMELFQYPPGLGGGDKEVSQIPMGKRRKKGQIPCLLYHQEYNTAQKFKNHEMLLGRYLIACHLLNYFNFPWLFFQMPIFADSKNNSLSDFPLTIYQPVVTLIIVPNVPGSWLSKCQTILFLITNFY